MNAEQPHHKAKLSHELIAAAAAYEVCYPHFGTKHADHLVGHEGVERAQKEARRRCQSCHG